MQQLKYVAAVFILSSLDIEPIVRPCGQSLAGIWWSVVARAAASFNGTPIFLVACRSDTLTIVACARVESRLESSSQVRSRSQPAAYRHLRALLFEQCVRAHVCVYT